MTDYAIQVKGLRKSYQGRAAVDGIDLDVRRGEVFALLGPNGAGKTTTVEILEGYRRRDGGEVRVLGDDPGTAGAGLAGPDRHRAAAVATDEQPSSPSASWCGTSPRSTRTRATPDEVIELVGLADKRDARTPHLSGGQRRRLDVALGIVGRPELLFLDEPTTGFDPEARRAVLGAHPGASPRRARRSCSPPTTSTRPRRWPTGSRVIAGGRIVALDTPAALGGRAQAAATVALARPGRPARGHRPTTPDRGGGASWPARFGGEVPDLAVTRPTLEDVYLRLIGAST